MAPRGADDKRATCAVEVAYTATTETGCEQRVMRAVAKLSDYLGEGRLDHAANHRMDEFNFALPSQPDPPASGRQAVRRPSAAVNTDSSKAATAKARPGESLSDIKATDRRVALFFNEEMMRHTHDWPHIEKAERLKCAFELLKKRGLAERCSLRRGRAATDVELLTAHTSRHIEEVRRITARVAADPTNRELREPDGPGGIFYSPAADHAARLASGCVIEATYAVLDAAPQATRSRGGGSSNQTSNGVVARPSCDAAFALIRPPGHHAGHDDSDGHRAEGFCFFNSACVAARCALETGRARRVAIIDWDIHHGNGTQSILYDDRRVLYVSLHRYGPPKWYPRTGAVDEVGHGVARGFNVNVPWPADGLGDSDYALAFAHIVCPITAAFAPDVVIISAGFDAAEGDAQGKMRLTPAGYAALTSMLLDAVDCPTVAALEGGYNVPVTSACCEAVVRTLLGERMARPPLQRPSPCCESTLTAVLNVQREFWPCLNTKEAKSAFSQQLKEAAEMGQAERTSKRARAPASRDYDAPRRRG